MMYCIKCKAQLNPGTKFCPYCGSSQQAVPSQTEPIRPQAPRSAMTGQAQFGQQAPAMNVPRTPAQPQAPRPAMTGQPQFGQQALAMNVPQIPAQPQAPRPAMTGQPQFGQQAPAMNVPRTPAQDPDSVFDFSMMENYSPVLETDITSTTMTPPRRAAALKKSRRLSAKGIAAIISGAAVLIAAAAVMMIMVLPGIMAKHDLAKAQEYLDAGNYDNAIVEFDKVIAADPDNVEAYNGKADALEEQGLLQEAADVLREGYKRTSSYLLSSRCDEIETELYSS